MTPTKTQLQNAMRSWLLDQNHDPDSDNAYLKLSSYCAYFEQNWHKIKNLKKYVTRAMKA